MHAIVVTRDDQVLLTKRSEKVSYHPGIWSCSLEEQLATQDLEAGPSRTVLQWCQHLLRKELGRGSGMYHDDNLRTLSVFLESAKLNISVCAHMSFTRRASIHPTSGYRMLMALTYRYGEPGMAARLSSYFHLLPFA